MKIIINTDGASRGNPGPAAIGVVVSNERGEMIKEYSKAIGEATNNEAEYEAVIFALQKVKALFGKEKAKKMEVEIHLDSELIAKQLNHQYKINEDHIRELFIRVWNLMLDFGSVNFKHIPRTKNKEADRLANEALDNEGREIKMF